MALKPSLGRPALTIAAVLLFAAPTATAALGGIADVSTSPEILDAPSLAVTTAAPAGSPGAANGNGNGNGNGPTTESVDIEFRLTGTAIRTDGGPDDSFTFYVNATGEGDRRTPNGNGVQIRADALEAQVVVVDADGNEVENYTANLRFHAQQASHLAQGLDGFRFNMQLTGQRSESVLVNEANPDGRVLAMNSHGTTVGEADEDGFHAVEGRGQTTTKTGTGGNDADHYNFILGGSASIVASE